MHIAVSTSRIALLIALALPLPLIAQADEAAHRAKAQELMAQLQTQKMVDQISTNILKQVSDAGDKLVGADATPEKKAKLADFKRQAAQVIDTQVGWKSMESGFTDVYAKNFTVEQIDAIVAFYKTPAGAALLANMPTVNTEVGKLGNTRMTSLQPQLKQLYDDFSKSLTAAAPPPSLGPNAPSPLLNPPAPAVSTPK